MAQDGHHGLVCRKSAGRHRRHALANDILIRAIRFIEVHAELEPPRLFSSDGKRPDGATLDPWWRVQYLVWDFTCPDTLVPSHVIASGSAADAAASNAETAKCVKYAELSATGMYLFYPVAIETLGSWGPSASELCREIGARIQARTGDQRSTAFLRQRLAVAIQRGNAAAISGTCPIGDNDHLL